MTGLVGWWPLNEDSGSTAYDLSGNGNHGSLNGGVTQGVSGKGGLTSYSFDGNDDYVDVGDSAFNLSEAISLSVWIKPDSLGQQAIISKTQGGSYSLYWDHPDYPDRISSFAYIDGDYRNTVSQNEIQADKWYHVVFTFDGRTHKLYLNGELQDSLQYSGSIDTTNVPLLIGAEPTDGSRSNYFNGEITDARVYDRVLSSEEAKELYEWGSGDYAKPLNNSNSSSAVSHYPLDGDATDFWSGNDGSVNGASFVDDAIRGKSASFDGNEDYIQISLTSQTDPMTVSFWARSETDDRGHILSNYGSSSSDWNIDWGNSKNTFRIWEDSGGDIIETTASYPKDSWHHVVLKVNGSGEAKFFVNGVKDAEGSGHEGMLDNGRDYQIGNRPDDNDYAFNGKIDDVRIYSKALSPSEVFELYRWGTRGRDMRKLTVNSRGL